MSTTPLSHSGSRPRTANPKRTRSVVSPCPLEELAAERRLAEAASAEDFGGANNTPPAETEVIWRKADDAGDDDDVDYRHMRPHAAAGGSSYIVGGGELLQDDDDMSGGSPRPQSSGSTMTTAAPPPAQLLLYEQQQQQQRLAGSTAAAAHVLPLERPHTRNPRLTELSSNHFAGSASESASSYDINSASHVSARQQQMMMAHMQDTYAAMDAAARIHVQQQQQPQQQQQQYYYPQQQQQQQTHSSSSRSGSPSAQVIWSAEAGVDPSTLVRPHTSNPFMERSKHPLTGGEASDASGGGDLAVGEHGCGAAFGAPAAVAALSSGRGSRSGSMSQQPHHTISNVAASAAGGGGGSSGTPTSGGALLQHSMSSSEVLWSSSQPAPNMLKRPSTSNPAKAGANTQHGAVFSNDDDDDSLPQQQQSNNNNSHSHNVVCPESAPLSMAFTPQSRSGAVVESAFTVLGNNRIQASNNNSSASIGMLLATPTAAGANYETLYSEMSERADRDAAALSAIIDDQRVRIAQLEEENAALKRQVAELTENNDNINSNKNSNNNNNTKQGSELSLSTNRVRKSSLRRSPSSGATVGEPPHVHFSAMVPAVVEVPPVTTSSSSPAAAAATAAATVVAASSEEALPVSPFTPADEYDAKQQHRQQQQQQQRSPDDVAPRRPPTPPRRPLLAPSVDHTGTTAHRRGSHPYFDLKATTIVTVATGAGAVPQLQAMEELVEASPRDDAIIAVRRPPTPPNAHHTVRAYAVDATVASPVSALSAAVIAALPRSPLPSMRPSVTELPVAADTARYCYAQYERDDGTGCGGVLSGNVASPVLFRPTSPTPPASPDPAASTSCFSSHSQEPQQQNQHQRQQAVATKSSSNNNTVTSAFSAVIPVDDSPADDAVVERIISGNSYGNTHGQHFLERVHARPESANFRHGRDHHSTSPPKQQELLPHQYQLPQQQRPASARVTSSSSSSAFAAAAGQNNSRKPEFKPAPPSSPTPAQGSGSGGQHSNSAAAAAAAASQRPLSAPIRRHLLGAKAGSPPPLGIGGVGPDSFRIGHLSPPSMHAARSAALGAAVDENYMRSEFEALADPEQGGCVPKARFMQLHRSMLVDFGMPIDSYSTRSLERTLAQFNRGGKDVLTYDEFSLLCLKFLAKW